MRVNGPPIALLHELVQAPEDLLFIRVVEEEQANNIVHALNVADLGVVVGVGLEHIKQLVIPARGVLRPQVQFSHRPVYIFRDLPLCFIVFELTQLLVEVVRVDGLGPVNVQKFGPEVPSQVIGDALIEHRVADLVCCFNRERPSLSQDLVPIDVLHGIHHGAIIGRLVQK